MEIREQLLALFNAGVAAVRAETCLPQHLPTDKPRGRTVIIAVGKAAGAMAQVALKHLDVDAGLLVTRYGHMPPGWQAPSFVRVIEAGHPSPDEASLAAGNAALDLAHSLGADDRLIALVSGGGSALMAAPAEGLALAEKQAITRALLASGAPIAHMNRVRAALSRVKGGRLAMAAYPAEVLTYVISDIPGDDPALVASGPTIYAADGSPPLDILHQYGIAVSQSVETLLSTRVPPTPVPTPVPTPMPTPMPTHCVVCARADDALRAMAAIASQMGYAPVMLGDALEGDAATLGIEHAKLAFAARARGERVALISGGEATVEVHNPDGKGGRNLTYALALAIALDGAKGIAAVAADSDGVDGNSNTAGAFVFPDSLSRINERPGAAVKLMDENQSLTAFQTAGSLLITGPTYTNVNDLRAILVDPAMPA